MHAHKTPPRAHAAQCACRPSANYLWYIPTIFWPIYNMTCFCAAYTTCIACSIRTCQLWCIHTFFAMQGCVQKVCIVQKLCESRLNLKCCLKTKWKKKCVGHQLEPCSCSYTCIRAQTHRMYTQRHTCIHACSLCKYAWEPTFAYTSESVNPCDDDDDATCQDTHTPPHQLLL